jgi:hypothetical protein
MRKPTESSGLIEHDAGFVGDGKFARHGGRRSGAGVVQRDGLFEKLKS